MTWHWDAQHSHPTQSCFKEFGFPHWISPHVWDKTTTCPAVTAHPWPLSPPLYLLSLQIVHQVGVPICRLAFKWTPFPQQQQREERFAPFHRLHPPGRGVHFHSNVALLSNPFPPPPNLQHHDTQYGCSGYLCQKHVPSWPRGCSRSALQLQPLSMGLTPPPHSPWTCPLICGCGVNCITLYCPVELHQLVRERL